MSVADVISATTESVKCYVKLLEEAVGK